jgi:hypothetical protein
MVRSCKCDLLIITMHANFQLISAALLLFSGCNLRAGSESDKKQD